MVNSTAASNDGLVPPSRPGGERNGGRRIVLVNGIPASGKSTIAVELSKHTGWLQLSLDNIKNPFLQRLEGVDRELNRTLGRASYQVMWSIVANAPAGSTFILDAWFGFQPKEVLVDYLAGSGVTSVVEIWCDVCATVAASRYQARMDQRLPGHPGAEYLPELIALAERAGPMNLGPVYRVDQSVAMDIDNMADWILRAFNSAANSNNETLRS